MKSFSYQPFLPSFIVSIRCFISSQSFLNFANTFLLPSIEVKTKYFFPLFSSIYPSALPMILDIMDLHHNCFHNYQFFTVMYAML